MFEHQGIYYNPRHVVLIGKVIGLPSNVKRPPDAPFNTTHMVQVQTTANSINAYFTDQQGANAFRIALSGAVTSAIEGNHNV